MKMEMEIENGNQFHIQFFLFLHAKIKAVSPLEFTLL